MPETTLKVVARLAGVGSTTVSRVVNGSERVAPETREKILAIIRDLHYTPNIHAANLRRKRLNDESISGSAGAEERKLLGQQITRLRRDLDRLRKHAERIQSCVNTIQKACFLEDSRGRT